jgi:hypothetical protein
MVAEAGMQREQFSFPGRCAGANAVWDDLELKQRLSRCLAVQSLRNLSTNNISITSDVWGGPARLGRGEVTPAFNGEPSNLSVAVLDDVSAYCGDVTSGGFPPAIEVELTLRCDRSLAGCDP